MMRSKLHQVRSLYKWTPESVEYLLGCQGGDRDRYPGLDVNSCTNRKKGATTQMVIELGGVFHSGCSHSKGLGYQPG